MHGRPPLTKKKKKKYATDESLFSGRVKKTYCAIHRIEIYPEDIVLHPSNNQGLISDYFVLPNKNVGMLRKQDLPFWVGHTS